MCSSNIEWKHKTIQQFEKKNGEMEGYYLS